MNSEQYRDIKIHLNFYCPDIIPSVAVMSVCEPILGYPKITIGSPIDALLAQIGAGELTNLARLNLGFFIFIRPKSLSFIGIVKSFLSIIYITPSEVNFTLQELGYNSLLIRICLLVKIFTPLVKRAVPDPNVFIEEKLFTVKEHSIKAILLLHSLTVLRKS